MHQAKAAIVNIITYYKVMRFIGFSRGQALRATCHRLARVPSKHKSR